MMTKRPIGVTILAIFSGMFGGGVLGTGMWLADLWNLTGSTLVAILASTFIIIGILGLMIGYGLWKGLFWARWLAIVGVGLRVSQVLFGFTLLLASSDSLLPMPTIIPAGLLFTVIVIDVLTFLYLTRPVVEVFFDDPERMLDYFALVLLPIPFASLPYALIFGLFSSPTNSFAAFCLCIVGGISGVMEMALTHFLSRD
jgi:hypothetical protein